MDLQAVSGRILISSTASCCSVMLLSFLCFPHLISILPVLQQEQVEWDDVNKLLQHHGFKTMHFADPVENKNLSGKSQWFQFCVKIKVTSSAIGSILASVVVKVLFVVVFENECKCLHVSLDLVLLDKKSAGEIRMTLKTMLTDSERRQALIQELIKSNNQLK